MICAIRSVSSYWTVVFTCKVSFCQQHYVYVFVNEELSYFEFVIIMIDYLDCWDAIIFPRIF